MPKLEVCIVPEDSATYIRCPSPRLPDFNLVSSDFNAGIEMRYGNFRPIFLSVGSSDRSVTSEVIEVIGILAPQQ